MTPPDAPPSQECLVAEMGVAAALDDRPDPGRRSSDPTRPLPTFSPRQLDDGQEPLRLGEVADAWRAAAPVVLYADRSLTDGLMRTLARGA